MSIIKNVAKIADLKYWAGLLIALLIFSLFLTPDLGSQYSRISDSDLQQSGTWKTINLARYSEGHAIFTREKGATLKHSLAREKPVTSIDIRYYSYGADTNTIKLSLGGQEREFSYSGKGIFTHSETFNPPVIARDVEATLVSLGQPAWVLDTLSLSHGKGLGFDLKRMLWQMALFSLLTAALWMATKTTITPVSSSGKIYISIDIFRGIGALLVLFLHSTGYAGLPDLGARPLLADMAKNGHYGVEVFYVISAFTLTYSLSSILRRKAENPITTFWNRRVNRIIPTFFAVFVLAVILRHHLSSNLTEENLLPIFTRFMTMTYVFDRPTLLGPIGHSVWWSISTEFQFYIIMPLLFFPIVAYLLKEKRHSALQNILMAIALSVGSILLMSFTRNALAEKGWLAYTLFYHLDAFIVGISLAILMMEWSKSRQAKQNVNVEQHEQSAKSIRIWTSLAYMGFIALLVVVAFSQPLGQMLSLPKSFVGSRLIVILATAVSIFSVRYCEERGANLSGAKALRTVGLLSFLIYLVHIPVLQIFTKISVPDSVGTDIAYYMWVLTGGLIGSIIVSIIIHRAIEIPSVRLNALATKLPILRLASTSLIVVIIVAFVLSFAQN